MTEIPLSSLSGIPPEVLLWGPGIVILIGLFLLVKYTVPKNFFGRFVEAQERQAGAIEHLTTALKELPRRDEFKFQELLIGQQMIDERIEGLDKRLDRIEGKL